ncbi:MAG: NAD(P)-dependent oxidoreductase [Aquisalinus sp.]|nr:NAD(P)-dependent oxidoreductase [Aquisalinus sp.]
MTGRILVTGSAGHLGEALMRHFREVHEDAVGIDLLSSPFTDLTGNICDRAFVRSAMQGVTAIIHTATLHKPHIATHTRQDFVDVNVTGTLNLLEEAVAAGVEKFIFTSTTSLYGDALRPVVGDPAVWVTEETIPQPKNIYGVTKTAAEDLCQIFHRNTGISCLILRTSRFFPEEDDSRNLRELYTDDNTKANEFLFRRVEIEDNLTAHICALDKAREIGFAKYIISATSPFMLEDLSELAIDARAVVRQYVPEYEAVYDKLNWQMFPEMGRVYVNEKARMELGWEPRYDFAHVIKRLSEGMGLLSPLALMLGRKGYHEEKFKDGPYPVDSF